ncbi:MAG: hypothetical protein U0793_25540 [Gemmataceae bacterium]
MAVPPPLPENVELGPLPRPQIGPFLTLGVDKDADIETIEAAWAQRLIWARKNLISIPLEDINWARDALKDPEKRTRSDAGSLNLETTDGFLQALRKRFQGKDPDTGSCKPIDVEKSLANYLPPTPVPEIDQVRQTLPVPVIPTEVPAVPLMLQEALQAELDPWDSIPH